MEQFISPNILKVNRTYKRRISLATKWQIQERLLNYRVDLPRDTGTLAPFIGKIKYCLEELATCKVEDCHFPQY